jgi:hypothetical protein
MKLAAATLCIATVSGLAAWTRPKCGTPNTGQDIISEWGKAVDPAKPILAEYPRPMMTRPESTYKNMNGLWEYAPGTGTDSPPFGKALNGSILVPFPVESCLSGVMENHPHLWYRTTFDAPFSSDSTLLHFGAVDWQTHVWLNGKLLGNHTGGYDGFSFDLSQGLRKAGNELIVGVFDPSDSGPQPQGKQRVAAIGDPGGDHYTPSSGIWQTVWLENVPAVHVASLSVGADLSKVQRALHALPALHALHALPALHIPHPPYTPPHTLTRKQYPHAHSLAVNTPLWPAPWPPDPQVYLSAEASDGSASGYTATASAGDKVVAKASCTTGSPCEFTVQAPRHWSPATPFLYDLRVTLDSGDEVGGWVASRLAPRASRLALRASRFARGLELGLAGPT